MTTENENNVVNTGNNNQSKQPLTPEAITAKIKTQLREAKVKSVTEQAKKLIEEIEKAEVVLKQKMDALKLHYAENSDIFN